MKILLHTFFLAILISSCATKSARQGQTALDLAQLSSQIENSNYQTYCPDSTQIIIEHPNNKGTIASAPLALNQYEKSKQRLNSRKTINKGLKKGVNSVKKIFSEESALVDKNNIFWKIGKVILSVGLIILSVFGGVFISSGNNGTSAFFSSGLFIGLCVLVLSLAFFLLAVITSYMKEKSKPIENPNEI